MELDVETVTPVINRLRRAHGQLSAVIRMLEQGRDCADVVTQLAAVSKAIDRAGLATIAAGLEECLREGEDQREQKERLERLFLSFA